LVRANFIGPDLTNGEKKQTACVALYVGLHLDGFGFLLSDGQIIEAIECHHPSIVAIYAPLSLPKGLCRLEESCPGQPLSPSKGRGCERDLSRHGTPCYYTIKRSIMKNVVYRAVTLKDEITTGGCWVIEVYPYAAKVQLFGGHIPGKEMPAGIVSLRGRLAAILPGDVQP